MPALRGLEDVSAWLMIEPASKETGDKMSEIEFHAVAKTGDLDEGEAVQVIVGRKEIAIYNLDGAFYATDDICTHAYASLADGYIEGELIECPLHGGCFDIKTGKAPTATGGRDKFATGGVAARLWCEAPPNRFMGREPLLPGGEFLSGETGQYQ